MKQHILVFRRQCVRVDAELYARYFEGGLLDSEHVIGEPYLMEKADIQLSKWVEVYFYLKLSAYSIIKAQCPSTWSGPFEKLEVQKDISQFTYSTTIGLAQFHEQLMNRAIPTVNVKGGRPPKEVTGRRGRPAKAKTTKKDVETAVAKFRGRTMAAVKIGIVEVALDNADGTIVGVNAMDTEIADSRNEDSITEDPDDNAGDADAMGDGSSYVDDQFLEYNEVCEVCEDTILQLSQWSVVDPFLLEELPQL